MRKLLSILLVITLISTSSFFPITSQAATTSYGNLISDVLDDFETHNLRADSAIQQTVNGTYRTVELLAVIAYILDN